MSNENPIPPNKRRRNLAVLAALVTFIVIVYAVTIVRMGAGG